MQIVIDISEELYKANLRGLEADEVWDLRVAVKNGTLLPKGHGRLKDVDWIEDNCDYHYSERDGSGCCAWRDIYNAPTIIEADEEESEENGKVCCNCRHNKRYRDEGGMHYCECEINGRFLSGVQVMKGWCRHWAAESEEE